MKRQRPPTQVNGHFFKEVHAQFPLGIEVERPAVDLHRFDQWEEDRITRIYQASAIQARKDFEAVLGPLEQPSRGDGSARARGGAE